MTAFSNTADFLRLLREDPDFRDEARRLVLSQELLELPDRLARFEANMERRFDGFERRFDELEGGTERQFTEVRSDITEMKGDIAKNTSEIGGLRGAEYERRVGRSLRQLRQYGIIESEVDVLCAGTGCFRAASPRLAPLSWT